MDFNRLTFNFFIGLEAIMYNRFRALLTSLGIIFGVAAVIAMLAIGKGTENEIAEQLKQVGSNNITITAVWKEDQNKAGAEATEEKEEEKVKRYTSGLTIADGENIVTTLKEYVDYASPEIELEKPIIYKSKRLSGKIIGVSNNFFDVAVLSIGEGKTFTNIHFSMAEPVCIIGKSLKAKLFTDVEPIGQKIKCGDVWLTIIGVLSAKNVSSQTISAYSVRNANQEVYIPVNTMLTRFQDRSRITPSDMRRGGRGDDDEDENKPQNYHQIDKLVVKVKNTEMMREVSEVVKKMLVRRHNNVEDFDIQIPELLLKQQQKNKRQFNILLAFIASISLVVGGIGIMNIMLASVMERIKEIGLRQSLGATRKDISQQFISEAVTISVSGGIIGVLFGVGLCYSIEWFSGIKTIITPISVIISFTISILVGLVSGIMPAKKASKQDPVESLRHE